MVADGTSGGIYILHGFLHYTEKRGGEGGEVLAYTLGGAVLVSSLFPCWGEMVSLVSVSGTRGDLLPLRIQNVLAVDTTGVWGGGIYGWSVEIGCESGFCWVPWLVEMSTLVLKDGR